MPESPTPESLEALTLARAEPTPKTRTTLSLTALAVVFFLLAIVLAAAPVLNFGPETRAGLLLLRSEERRVGKECA